MSKKTIALMYGGQSPEHEVSVRSARNIFEALDKEKYEVILIGIDYEGRWWETTAEQLNRDKTVVGEHDQQLMLLPGEKNGPIRRRKDGLIVGPPTVIFPIIHGPNGEDGSLQGIFMQLDIPFVGPGVLGSAAAMDKEVAKRLLNEADLLVADFFCFRDHEKEAIDFHAVVNKLGLPLFVKPANMGSSVGVSKAKNYEEFQTAVQKAFQYDTKIIVEEGIVGRELECAVMGNQFPETTDVGEVLMDDHFYDYEAKYVSQTDAKTIIPATNIDDQSRAKLLMVAKSAYQCLECEGLTRVDMFLCEDGRVYINELNTLPGFTSISMYPKLWEANNLPYQALIDRLIELAEERWKRRKELVRTF